ncbi:hypothetical protein O9993_22145 [Vibrio lentus]|nr:hypothetical protein [Vibrio lentus]
MLVVLYADNADGFVLLINESTDGAQERRKPPTRVSMTVTSDDSIESSLFS